MATEGFISSEQGPGDLRIRVLVVAPVRLYREGLVRALERDGRVEVVGATASEPEAIALVASTHCDEVILDVGACPPWFVRELIRRRPELRVIAFAVTETPGNIIEWAEAGVVGFVSEDGTVDDLIAAITSASREQLACSPVAAAALLSRVRSVAGNSGSDAQLTRRETEIAQLIEKGLMNKEIATRLGIELPTVKNHVHRILEKLGTSRRADAAAYIRRIGLLRD